jgi:hypothetical protein
MRPIATILSRFPSPPTIGVIAIAAVPEPTAIGACAGGALAFVAFARRLRSVAG